MITKYGTYINEKISSKDIKEEYDFFYDLHFLYEKTEKEYILNLSLNDDLNDGYEIDDILSEYAGYIDNYLEINLAKILKIKSLKEIETDKFLMVRYLFIAHQNKYDDGDNIDIYNQEYMDSDVSDISITYKLYTVNQLFDIIKYILKDFINVYKYDAFKYTEHLIENDSAIINDKYFLDIIENNEILKDKYKHVLDAKNFDLI